MVYAFSYRSTLPTLTHFIISKFIAFSKYRMAYPISVDRKQGSATFNWQKAFLRFRLREEVILWSRLDRFHPMSIEQSRWWKNSRISFSDSYFISGYPGLWRKKPCWNKRVYTEYGARSRQGNRTTNFVKANCWLNLRSLRVATWHCR